MFVVFETGIAQHMARQTEIAHCTTPLRAEVVVSDSCRKREEKSKETRQGKHLSFTGLMVSVLDMIDNTRTMRPYAQDFQQIVSPSHKESLSMSLPPLTAVRAFDAVARHLSFTKAGEELGMTQAAVSYQIKLLEERVGAPLFIRKPRQIALTDVGDKLAPEVRQAFEILRDAFADTRGEVDGLLSVTTVATFASQWLAQNLGLFQIAHPDIAVRLDSSSTMVDLLNDEFDIGIRTIPGPQGKGLVSHLLVKADFTPLLSPALAQSIGGIHEPQDLLKLPILDPQDEWWEQWFTAAGVEGYSSQGRPLSVMGWQSLLGTAAAAGRGVTMLTPALFRDEIASGQLLQPFPLLASAGRGYYLVYPESRRNARKIKMFRDWILEATAYMREES